MKSLGRTYLVQHTIDTGDSNPQAHIAAFTPRSDPLPRRSRPHPKKDDSFRLCINHRRHNAVTVLDSFPLSRLDGTLDVHRNTAWFSTPDLKSEHWQADMHPNDRHKTAFTVPQGLFESQPYLFGSITPPRPSNASSISSCDTSSRINALFT
nr:unnamed protein product [Spirometra erinaceieuropaei]